MTAQLIRHPEAEPEPDQLLHSFGIDIDDTDPNHPKLEVPNFPALTAFDQVIGEVRLRRETDRDPAAEALLSLRHTLSNEINAKLGDISEQDDPTVEHPSGPIVLKLEAKEADLIRDALNKVVLTKYVTTPRPRDEYSHLFDPQVSAERGPTGNDARFLTQRSKEVSKGNID